jgi:hypothetical protein
LFDRKAKRNFGILFRSDGNLPGSRQKIAEPGLTIARHAAFEALNAAGNVPERHDKGVLREKAASALFVPLKTR